MLRIKELLTSINEGVEDIVKAYSFKDKRGNTKAAFAIDPLELDTHKHKDILKKHGATYFKNPKDPSSARWSFNDWKDDPSKLLNDNILPALDEILAAEKISFEKRDAIIKILTDEFISVLHGGAGREIGKVKSDGKLSQTEIDNLDSKFKELKYKLLTVMSDEEFKNFMKPIIAFKNRQHEDYRYSLYNTLLIYIQDPKATYVLPGGAWKKFYHRTINKDAIMIALARPKIIPAPKSILETIKREFLESINKESIDDLTGGEKRQLQILQNKAGYHSGEYEMNAYWTDIRFTSQMEGTSNEFEDYDQGKENLKNLKWYDDSGVASKETLELEQAIKNVCAKHGIDIADEDISSGARGYSANGGKKIRLLANSEVNDDFIKTMVHELTHSLCHWENSKFKLKKDYGHQEQEAEMVAWMVLMMYGYESVTETSTNYMGSWGLDENNASIVFDRMMKVAEYIYAEINKELAQFRNK